MSGRFLTGKSFTRVHAPLVNRGTPQNPDLEVSAASGSAAGSLSATDYTALANARAAGIVVQVQRSRMFGVAGDAVYTNATTGWTAVGAQFKAGPGSGLLAAPSGATRRWRLEIVYQQTIGGNGANLQMMTGGAPGVGTAQITVSNLPFTGGPAATYHGLYVTDNTVGAPYNSADPTWYGQAATAGNLSVWAIDCVIEDYIP